jgi:hypothetical protein
MAAGKNRRRGGRVPRRHRHKPLDAATSHYNLARALRASSKEDEAKDELLLALETAPGFRPAQKMLLELSKEEIKK